MTDRIFADIVTILTAIIGLAIFATLVSSKSSTANVITSAGKAFASDLQAATGTSSGLPSLS